MEKETKGEKKEKKKGVIFNLKVWLTNQPKNLIGRVKLGKQRKQLPRRSYVGKDPYTYQKYLNPYITLNDARIKSLKVIEQKWLNIEYILGSGDKKDKYGSKEYETLAYLYQFMGPYKDAVHTVLELGLFEKGIGYNVVDDTKIHPITKKKYDVPQFKTNDPVKVVSQDGVIEELIPIGKDNYAQIGLAIKGAYEQIDSKSLKGSDKGWSDIDVDDGIDGVFKEFQDFMGRVKKMEEDQFKRLKTIWNIHKTNIKSLWTKLESYKCGDLQIGFNRFNHTYKIIAPFIYKVIYKGGPVYMRDPLNIPGDIDHIRSDPEVLKTIEIITFKDTMGSGKNKDDANHPKFERYSWEVEEGLDHNGMPLEVDEEGYVLTDIWWIEQLFNPWQRDILETKIGKSFKGEYGRIIRKIVDHFKGICDKHPAKINKIKNEHVLESKRDLSKEIQKIAKANARKIDTRFKTVMDVGMAAAYCSAEFDSYRDDHRDARFHNYSKTSFDYTNAMYKFNYKRFVNKVQNTGVFSFYSKIKKGYKSRQDYLTATPYDFPEPGQEKDIQGDYDGYYSWPYEEKGDDFDEDPYKGYELDKKPGPASRYKELDHTKHKEGIRLVRRPSHMNPGWDRRAMKGDFIHWGRLYYYEWPEDVNKYSENPFPAVTDRGVINYIVDMLLKLELKLSDQKKVLKKSKQGYDWGVRQQGVNEYKTDIFDPDGCVNYGYKKDDESKMKKPET